MTDFPYIGGIEVSAIQNREFIRIETDKAQAIVVALDKSNIPFSARFGDAEPVQTVDKVPTFEELYDAYQRRHANDHFTREAHKHLAEISRRRQRDEQERIAQTEERERKNRP